ncbi:hypothetical protein ZWY2020_035663 [Hordeum vulgare]|nr:hypothetical protein ZWY2020_035663 [Hordeum vulgare]
MLAPRQLEARRQVLQGQARAMGRLMEHGGGQGATPEGQLEARRGEGRPRPMSREVVERGSRRGEAVPEPARAQSWQRRCMMESRGQWLGEAWRRRSQRVGCGGDWQPHERCATRRQDGAGSN